MSADTLRQAASLMRERAEDATPSPWQEIGTDWSDDGLMLSGYVISLSGDTSVGEDITGDGMSASDAAYVAGMHPAVALLVADWLDFMADKGQVNTKPEWYVLGWDRAIEIARAYLGSDQP